MKVARIAALACALFSGSQCLAEEKVVNLRLSLFLPASHPVYEASKQWADSVEKDSGGTIKTTLFPAEQLGKAFDQYDMARDGIADMAVVVPGYQPGRFPILGLSEVPFTVSDGVKGSRAIDAWYRNYAATEMKDTHFCLAFLLEPGSFHSRRKQILVPDDLKGMKVRPSQATIGAMVKLLGGTNVQASIVEAREAIERGVADAVTSPSGSIVLFGIDKVTKYHMDTPFYTSAFTYSMNKAFYEGLSAAQKRVIGNHCTSDWAERTAGPWAAFEKSGREKLKSQPGHEIYQLSPDQIDQWKKVIAPLKEAWATNVRKAGADPAVVEGEFAAALAKEGGNQASPIR